MASYMTSLILLESARRYNKLATEIFSFSVEQSGFASKVQSQRIALANAIVAKNEDFRFKFNDEFLCLSKNADIVDIWSDCVGCDLALQEAFQKYIYIFQHFQYVIEKSKGFLEELTTGRQAQLYTCSVCGAVYAEEEITELVGCSVCDAAANLQIKL